MTPPLTDPDCQKQLLEQHRPRLTELLGWYQYGAANGAANVDMDTMLHNGKHPGITADSKQQIEMAANEMGLPLTSTFHLVCNFQVCECRLRAQRVTVRHSVM